MKRSFFWGALILGCAQLGLASAVLADDATQLRQKLSAMQALSADFSSEAVRSDGGKSESSGKLALKRPDKMILHTLSPDETVLYTKGDDIFYFDPFVNQLSIYKRSAGNTSPFLLLTDHSDALWKNYEVKGDNGNYTVISKQGGDIVSMDLQFDGDKIKTLILKMKDGTVNSYFLSNVASTASDADFSVQIPDDAEIDDERGAN